MEKIIIPEETFTPKSAVEQWDQLAYQVIYRQLAPKGFKKVKSGAFRGMEIANLPEPGIQKRTVVSSQRIAAQLVRSYREKLRKTLNQRLQKVVDFESTAVSQRDKSRWWQFRKKRAFQKEYEHWRDQSGLIQIIIGELDKIEIK